MEYVEGSGPGDIYGILMAIYDEKKKKKRNRDNLTTSERLTSCSHTDTSNATEKENAS